jgi:hypothetical protein
MFRKITSQKPDRFPKPVRFKAGNYLSEKLYNKSCKRVGLWEWWLQKPLYPPYAPMPYRNALESKPLDLEH